MDTFWSNTFSAKKVGSYNSFLTSNGEERIYKSVSNGVTVHEWDFSQNCAGLNLEDYLNCRDLAKTDERLAKLLIELETIYFLLKK
jgi:hypothetical protein